MLELLLCLICILRVWQNKMSELKEMKELASNVFAIKPIVLLSGTVVFMLNIKTC